MPLISSPSLLRTGDVVIHSSTTFGLVTAVESDHAVIEWLSPADMPIRWSGPNDGAALRLAMPGSFFARAVAQRSRLSQDLIRRPFDILALLLDSLQDEATGHDIQQGLVAASLCSAQEAAEWWQSVQLRLHESERRDLRWDGQTAALSPPARPQTEPGRAFVTARPQERWGLWQRASDEDRAALIEYSFQTGDSVASTAAVRLMDRVPSALAPRILKHILRGDARLGAATLLWVPNQTFDPALATAAARRDLRPVLRRILERIPPHFQGPVVLRLLAQAVHEDEPAALFLADLLPQGPASALMQLDELLPAHPKQDRVRRWLQERMSESTMERPVRVAAPLLEQLAPVPVERLFPVSLALARALARRHAEGSAGGMDGARWRAPDEVILGAPSASSPTQDVRDAMRQVAELAVGSMPRGGRVRDSDLIHHLNGLIRDIPPAWMAVLCRCLDERPELRPVDGLDLWRCLERARSTEAVRKSAPIRLRQTTRSGFDSHIGAHKSRTGQTNQDAFWIQSEGHVTLLAVADGISVATAGSGDLASSLLVQSCAKAWDEWCDRLQRPDATEVEARTFLEQVLDDANQTICAAARRIAGAAFDRHIPMGTTAVLALIIGDRLHIAHLGDSRAWLIGPDGAAQLTGDQNLRQDWLRSWQVRDPLDLVADGNVLTGFLGHFNEQGQPEMLPISHRSLSLLPGETLAVSTDGFSDYAADSPRELAELLEQAAHTADLPSAARALVNAANAGGGGDNVTVVLAKQETTT